MVRKQISPAVSLYCKELAKCVYYKKEIGVNFDAEKKVLERLSDNNVALLAKSDELEKLLNKASHFTDVSKSAMFFSDEICKTMNEMRAIADNMESYTARNYWPLPTYGDLMFCI